MNTFKPQAGKGAFEKALLHMTDDPGTSLRTMISTVEKMLKLDAPEQIDSLQQLHKALVDALQKADEIFDDMDDVEADPEAQNHPRERTFDENTGL